MAKIPAEIAERVDGYVAKYMDVLDIDAAPPKTSLINRPQENWLARAQWNVKRPEKTVLEFQTVLFQNDKNDDWLERSIAHEMIHYRDTVARAKDPTAGHDPSGHGRSFHEGAERINAIMGTDFVTPQAVKLPTGTFISTSDLATVQAEILRKLAVTLTIGGAAFLGLLLASRKPSEQAHRPSVAGSFPNERGRYGRR